MTAVAQDDLAEFRRVADDLLAGAASSERVRAVVAAGGAPDRALFEQAAEMGFFGLEVPEDLGGAGAGFTELALLLEVAGSRLTSLPLVSSAVLCTGAVLLAGSPDQRRRWLPGLAGGHILGAALLPGVLGSGGSVAAVPEGADLRLTGTADHVLDARTAGLLVVCARDGAGVPVVGVVAADAPGVRVEPVAMTDATRPVDAVHLDGVALSAAEVLARGEAAEHLVAALVNRAAVALAAEAVGIAARVLEMTVAYTSQRTQFGRAIGSFQAVKHQAADMFVDTGTSRELVRDAVRRVAEDPGGPDTGVAASMAKAHACEKAARCAGVAVQLHGGIGYTWEHDLHLYLKRAKLDEQLYGPARRHRDRVAAHVLDRGGV